MPWAFCLFPISAQSFRGEKVEQKLLSGREDQEKPRALKIRMPDHLELAVTMEKASASFRWLHLLAGAS